MDESIQFGTGDGGIWDDIHGSCKWDCGSGLGVAYGAEKSVSWKAAILNERGSSMKGRWYENYRYDLPPLQQACVRHPTTRSTAISALLRRGFLFHRGGGTGRAFYLPPVMVARPVDGSRLTRRWNTCWMIPAKPGFSKSARGGGVFLCHGFTSEDLEHFYFVEVPENEEQGMRF